MAMVTGRVAGLVDLLGERLSATAVPAALQAWPGKVTGTILATLRMW